MTSQPGQAEHTRSILDRDRLVEMAMAATGLDDLGDPTWQEGLDLLLEDFATESRLNELGVTVAEGDIVGYLTNRLQILHWRREHPAVAAEPITRPIVIAGQPRTGTTILFDLLAQDPRLRAPLTWEVDCPVPPPDPGRSGPDPRIAEVDAVLAMADAIVPGLSDFHPLGALLAQECVRMTAGDFRSMIFMTQYRVPNYNRWQVREADMAPAYRWHRQYLQHLQSSRSETTPRQWLLKSPAHLWHLPALLNEYPDAVVIQNHRDPLKVVPSVSALIAHLRRMASDDISLPEIAQVFADDCLLGLDRSMEARDDGVLPPDRVIDVHFTDLVESPFPTIRGIYAQLDLDLPGPIETRMRDFLAANPGDGGGGGTRYRFADTGLDAGVLRERSRAYQDRFAVVSEPVQ